MASQEKISVHSLADLKNTSDDAIPAYLNSLKFKQSHTLTDVRLGLGYTAFSICAACFYWDYKLGFESTKQYTAFAVLLYTILNGILTFWMWGVEKGTVYTGTSPSGEKVTISTSTVKHKPTYHITVQITGKDGKAKKDIRISRPFAQWFDAKGSFVSKPFQQMFASNVEAVGMLDQKNIVRGTDEGKKVVTVAPSTASLDEKWASLLAESQPGVTGVSLDDQAPTKRTKGKKKA
ncbi:microsomal signal peptidase 25 kDa subunit [Phlyctema vagabunda]|uniref:Signal peptidase complex subunit 2 n=1 Tax=Phlyctema vagabunda TaxID=108571 RepID=A0ABR4P2S1_9HELO